MKKKKMILTVLTLLLLGVSMNAQNEKFKALFLYNFIKDIEWPAAYTQGDLVIGILGNNPIQKDLENISANQKAGNQTIKVKTFSGVDEIRNCHVVYISPGKAALIGPALAKLNGSNTLIVSDTKGGIQLGAGINFITDGEKLKFEISKSHIEQKGLKVSIRLLNLGTVIN
jgi:hypothetical protein